MKKQNETKGKRRTHYSDEFKREALVRAGWGVGGGARAFAAREPAVCMALEGPAAQSGQRRDALAAC